MNQPHFMDRIINRNKLVDDTRKDILERLNADLAISPFAGLFVIVDYEVMWNTLTKHWDVTFRCEDQRKFVTNNARFYHIYIQSEKRLYKTNNRIRAYLGVIALMLKKYTIEINTFYHQK